jgi:hypothetical protein
MQQAPFSEESNKCLPVARRIRHPWAEGLLPRASVIQDNDLSSRHALQGAQNRLGNKIDSTGRAPYVVAKDSEAA